MKILDAADLFCGAGGMTTGATQSGHVRVVLAVNHSRVAIRSHHDNHPATRHICAEMAHIDPAHDPTLPDVDLVMAGVECTHHSNAKGGCPVSDQRRSSARHVLEWARAKRPKWVIVENVREFLDWGPTRIKLDANRQRIWDRKHQQWAREPDPDHKGEHFRAWVANLKKIGYHVEHRLLNAADYGEPTKRIRLFVIARLGKRAIPWPEPTHAQVANGKPRWRAAAEIIDWSKSAPSIFGRKRPLASKTLRRIEIGLWRFCAPKSVAEAVARSGVASFLVKLRGTGRVADCHDPLPTITAGGTHLCIAEPFLVRLAGPGSQRGDGCRDLRGPLATILTREDRGICEPFLVKYHSGAEHKWRTAQSPLWEPMPTLDTQPRFGLVEPFLFGVDHRGSNGAPRAAGQPLTTITSKQRHCLVEPFIYQLIGRGAGRSYAIDAPLPTILAAREQYGVIEPFIVPHFGERDGQLPRTHRLDNPLPTVTGQGAGSLVQPFVLQLSHTGTTGRASYVYDPFEPLRTLTGSSEYGIAMPFLLPRQGYYDAHQLKRCRSIQEPLNTITANHVPAHLIVPYLVEINHGEGNRSPGGRVHSLEGPLGTVTTHRSHGLILPEPFLVKYQGTAVGQSIDAPLSTLTTKPRHGLALFGDTQPGRQIVVLNRDEARLWRTMDLLGITDIGFRMLDVDELASAMGLPRSYYLHGNKAEQIKQIGNMVCVGVMRAICRAIGQAA